MMIIMINLRLIRQLELEKHCLEIFRHCYSVVSPFLVMVGYVWYVWYLKSLV